MSAPIGPGDLVECIDAAPRADDGLLGPEVIQGCLYRVHDIVAGECFDDGEPALELVEHPDVDETGERLCWHIDRFRPVFRRDGQEELLRILKTPLPERVTEDA